ncbi:MAG: cytidine deaminase [Candidatus Eremiobacteraeota bacterium]|nr:cytidine deaminase [Candidatus Eremiobacteraeota bacterium]
MNSADDARLLAAARAARANAYAPYSKFSVGAALLCEDGTVVTGVNVENASYGMTMCAERTAVFTAVASGKTRFAAIAVAGPPGVTTPPCGACRQVLAEFGRDLRLSYATADGTVTTTVGDLLPATFVLP